MTESLLIIMGFRNLPTKSGMRMGFLLCLPVCRATCLLEALLTKTALILRFVRKGMSEHVTVDYIAPESF